MAIEPQLRVAGALISLPRATGQLVADLQLAESQPRRSPMSPQLPFSAIRSASVGTPEAPGIRTKKGRT